MPKWLEKALKRPAAQDGIDKSLPSKLDMEKPSNEALNDAYAAGSVIPDIKALEKQHDEDVATKSPDAAALARQLALAIRRAAHDMTLDKPRQYTYEEWVEFTRLIRFSAVGGPAEALKNEEDEGLIQWDWLAENSPMMAQENESEFVLERLCESLVRYLRRNPPQAAFAGTVREKGEAALRLKNEHWHEDEADPNPVDTKSRRPSSIATKLVTEGDDGTVGGLHVLHEEDDEHHEITPIR
jgi:potassium channel subfamily K